MRPDHEAGDGRYAAVGDSPAAVDGVAEAFTRAAASAASVANRFAGVVPGVRSAWGLGEAGEAAYERARQVRQALGEAPGALRSAMVALQDYRGVLVRGRRDVEELNQAYAVLAPAQQRVEAFGDLTKPGHEVAYDRAVGDLHLARAHSGYRDVAEMDAQYEAVVRRVTAGRDECASMLTRLSAAVALPGGRPGQSVLGSALPGMLTKEQLLARAGFSSLPTSPAEVKRFWDSLSASERASLLASEPRVWGNLNGVPCLDRDWANRTALDQDLARFRQYFIDHGVTPPTTVDEFDRLSLDDRVKLGLQAGPMVLTAGTAGLPTSPEAMLLVEEFKDALSTQFALTRMTPKLPTYLLAYDPTLYNGEGRVAIAFGNPDTADNVAVCVPGLESRASKMEQIGADAAALYLEAKRADDVSPTAVIAWQGYDAPEFDNVASQANADTGAPLLVADVQALHVTHADSAVNVTVVAHSYGSTTAGLALQRYGLADSVDQVVMIGSPGVGGVARTVADLQLSHDRLFVGSASTDVVTTTYGALGADPSVTDFGATRFGAENISRQLGLPWQFDDHSKYYDDVTHYEALYSMADIVTGQSGQLAEHGMLAVGRDSYIVANPLGPPTLVTVDPERVRTPTSGHQH